MSRVIATSRDERYTLAHGYDRIDGGYFIQVYDKEAEDNEDVDPTGEGLIVNDGFYPGLSQETYFALMEKYVAQYGIDTTNQKRIQ